MVVELCQAKVYGKSTCRNTAIYDLLFKRMLRLSQYIELCFDYVASELVIRHCWLIIPRTGTSSLITGASNSWLGLAWPAADHLAVDPRPLEAVRTFEPVERLQGDVGQVSQELLVLDTALENIDMRSRETVLRRTVYPDPDKLRLRQLPVPVQVYQAEQSLRVKSRLKRSELSPASQTVALFRISN